MTRNSTRSASNRPSSVRLASMPQAIRSAMAMPVLALALAGSGAAYAGSCGITGPNTVECDGVFNTPVPDAPLVTVIDDLTLILGSNGPTSVQSDGVDGVQMVGISGSETLINYGSITTYGGYGANAVDINAYGDVTFDNAGSVIAYVDAYSGSVADVTAVVLVSDDGDIQVLNQAGAAIEATASLGDAVAVSAVAYDGSVDVYNAGSISASTYGHNAVGIYAVAGGGTYYPDYSVVDITNAGSIESETSTYYGRSYSTGIIAYGHDVTVVNEGSIDTSADIYHGNAVAIGVQAVANSFSTAINTGEIDVSASSGGGVYYGPDAFALGVSVIGSSALIANYGDITVDADAYSGFALVSAFGTRSYAVYGFATTVNYGDISVTSQSHSQHPYGAYAFAYGTWTQTFYGNYAASTVNEGTITTLAEVYRGAAISVGTFTNAKYTSTLNNGVISANAVNEYTGVASAVGVQEFADFYSHVVNNGTVNAYALSHNLDDYGHFAYGSAGAIGTYQNSNFLGGVVLENNGDIHATAIMLDVEGYFGSLGAGAGAVGAYQYGKYYAGLTNNGDITAYAYGELGFIGSYGVRQRAKYGAVSVVDNSEGASIVSVSVSGSADDDLYAGRALATGIQQFATSYGYIYNDGVIYASATVNPNDRLHVDYGYGRPVAYAFGTHQDSENYSVLHNNGVIVAMTDAEFADIYTYGAKLSADHYGLIDNLGSIAAIASGAHGQLYTYGAEVIGARASMINNQGSITASSNADYGQAFTAGSVSASPSEKVYAGCGPYACYYNYYGGDARQSNDGDILAISNAYAGTAIAYGSATIGREHAWSENQGTIVSIANADLGEALAVGSIINNTQFGSAIAENSGGIYAYASGGYASAAGLWAIGNYGDYNSAYYAAHVSNSGHIVAIADGDYASIAVGVNASGRYGDGAYVRNEDGGTIIAAAYGADAYATGVFLGSYGVNVLRNYGTIAALGDGERVAVGTSLYSVNEIYNYGLMVGAVRSGYYNDYLYNADGAVWVAVGDSDFSYGDDTIINNGAIVMDESSIDLGYHADEGNLFVNNGAIYVNGDYNLIHLGHGSQSLVPSLNPLPFYNYGTIDFHDGAPDDLLVIVGDFAGEGSIDIDLSLANETSDLLYIDGSVAAGTVQTINIDLSDEGFWVPTQAETIIPIVEVSGVSVDSNFVLGAVTPPLNPAQSFLTYDFDVFADIDASNATPDIHYLGMFVTGLSDPGTIAAALAGGAQAMMDTQIGTWRQREGVIQKQEKSGLSFWARVVSDKANIDPGHVAANFGQGGNFAYKQTVSGVEMGANFAITDEFSLGALLAWNGGDLTLKNPGHANADLEGSTWGLYGTWISPSGFYMDLSYRSMDWEAVLSSSMGSRRVEGAADAWNAEFGYSFDAGSDWKIEPQFQYTHVTVNDIDPISAPGMVMSLHGGDSSRARLGVAVRKSFAHDDWMVTPHATLSAVRQLDGENSYDINQDFFGYTSTEGTSGVLELGLDMAKDNWAVFGGFNWTDGGAIDNAFGGQIGVRYTFGSGEH